MSKLSKDNNYQFKKARGFVLYPELIKFAQFLSAKLGIEITADGLDIRETSKGLNLTTRGGEGESSSSSHPFKVTLDTDEFENQVATVNSESFVFFNIGAGGSYTIVDLDASFIITVATDIYLEWEFSAWPNISTVTMKAGVMPAPVADDGVEQTFGRRRIAHIDVDVDDGITVTQLVFTHLHFELANDAGLPIMHLFDY